MAERDDRIPCPDDLCTGTINEQGFCNYCGISENGRPAAAPEEEPEELPPDGDRIPCADDLCTGTLNDQGVCNYCGRSHPGHART
jgi:hypothetical protein